jgi:hypothetical protein
MTTAVREIMPQMRSRHTNCLPILQTTYILPNAFIITKRRPTMRLGFIHEFLHGSILRCDEERCSRVGIIECHGRSLLPGFFGFFEEGRNGLEVSAVFGIVSVEVADSVGVFSVYIPSKIFLHRSIIEAINKKLQNH